MTLFSVFAAVLIVMMVIPVLGVTSNVAKTGFSFFNDLPSYIQLGKLSQANTIYATRGGSPSLIATIYDQNREDVAWGAFRLTRKTPRSLVRIDASISTAESMCRPSLERRSATWCTAR